MSHNLYTLNNDGADVASYHGATQGVLYIGRGESATYSGPLTSNSFYEFYDTNPINTLGATLTQGASVGWYKSFGLSAGSYEIHVNALITGSGTDPNTTQCGCFFHDGTNYKYVAVMQNMGPFLKNEWAYQIPSSGNGFFTISTAKTMTFLISPGTSFTPSDIGGRMAECSFLYIRKVA